MSKISEYLDAVRDYYARQEMERKTRQSTVAGYAQEMGMPVDRLIRQLADVGFTKSEHDALDQSERVALLDHLRSIHGSGGERKKIVVEHESESVTLLRAVAARENGAEWDALHELTDRVIFGLDIDPDLQRLVNLIVAKSFVQGGLPSMKRGRPKSDETEQLGRDVAQAYWDLRDGGTPYAEAVATVSERFHKDERHIMRMVKAHTEDVGATLERRQMWRLLAETMRWVYSAEVNREPKPSVYETILDGLKLPPELESQEFEDEDYLDHLGELIRKEADAKPLVTRKIRVLRSVTQRD